MFINRSNVVCLVLLIFCSCRSVEKSNVKDIHDPSSTYASTLVWVKNGKIFKGYCKIETPNCLPLPKNYSTGYMTDYTGFKDKLRSENLKTIALAEESLKAVVEQRKRLDPTAIEQMKGIEVEAEKYKSQSTAVFYSGGKVEILKKNVETQRVLVSDYESLLSNINLYLEKEPNETYLAVKQRYSEELSKAKVELDSVSAQISESEAQLNVESENLANLKASLESKRKAYKTYIAGIDIELAQLYEHQRLQGLKKESEALEILFNKIELRVPFTVLDMPEEVRAVFAKSNYYIRNHHLEHIDMSIDLNPFQ